MLRLTAHHIKSFGVETVLEHVTFSIHPGERVGLVGPNGCGKTTLLRILAGLDEPDSGAVQLTPSDVRVGYLAQGMAFRPNETLGEFLARGRDDARALTEQVRQLAESPAHAPARRDLQREYDASLVRLSAASFDEGRVPVVLSALGLERLPLATPVGSLSGGQKTRLALAGVLLSNPQLLLLDEPTNHLDIPSRARFEQALSRFEGTVLAVVHDRYFIERFATQVCEIRGSDVRAILSR